MLRLLSDRMRGRGFVAGKVWDEERCDEDTEVRLPLDALPSEVIRELQVIVQREKGLVVIKASLRLDAVRGLLKEAVAEYREMMKDAWT